MFAEAGRRDPGHARPWVTLVDGNPHQIAPDHGQKPAAAEHRR